MRVARPKAAKFALAVLLCCSIAQAQDLGVYYSGMAYNGLITNQLNITQMGIGRNLARTAQRDAAARAKAGSAPAAQARLLSFRASEALRQRNYAQFVARTQAVDPGGAAGLEANLRDDPVARMVPDLAQVGLRIDNVADAYAVYWIEAWEAAHGTTGNSSRKLAQAVKQQAAEAILATSEFAVASDTQKQELADALFVQALLLSAMREQNKADPAMLRRIGDAARQGARGMGIDLDAMRLTERGFSARN